jgi:hypothetical protein
VLLEQLPFIFIQGIFMRLFLLALLCSVSLNTQATDHFSSQIIFSIILTDDSGRVISNDTVDAKNNNMVQLNRTQQARFPSCQKLPNGQSDCTYSSVTTGLQLSVIPTFQSDGKISAQLDASYSVLDSTQKLNYDDFEAELPQIITSVLKQRIIFSRNKEIHIPFGLIINGRNLYALKISAMTERPSNSMGTRQNSRQINPLLELLLERAKK